MKNGINLIGRYPLVPLKVVAKEASWFGKWTLNTSSETVIALGGPWETVEQLTTDVLAKTSLKLRPDCASPHFE